MLSFDEKNSITFFSIVGILVMTVFGISELARGVWINGSVELFLATVALINLFISRTTGKYFFSKVNIMLILSVLLIFLMSSGGIGRTGIYWTYTYPILAFYLFGTKKTWMWLIQLFSIIGVFMVLTYSNIITTYSLIELRQLLFSIITISLFNYFIQRSYEEITQGLEDKTQNLLQANNMLDEEIVTREDAQRLLQKNVTELEDLKLASLNILEDLHAEKGKIEAILRSIGDGVVAVDKNRNILFINHAAKSLLGIVNENVVGRKYHEVWKVIDKNNEEPELADRPIERVLTNGQQIEDSHYSYVSVTGKSVPVSITTSPIELNGSVVGVIDVFKDITQERKIDLMKTEFLSLASHQLRTPLTAIKWFIDILNTSKQKSKFSKDETLALSNIYKSNERMIELVNGLLNITRIESGRIMVEPVKTNMGELVKNIVEEISPDLNKKKQSIKYIKKSFDFNLLVDPKLIRQVFLNLLSNASKYSPVSTTIEVTVSTKGENYQFSVRDHGFGIPQEQQSKVFSKFFRAANILPQAGGTGLGLYLVKQILDVSGGKIWFESEEKKGSVFYFTLPKKGSKAKAGEVRIDE